MTLAPYFAELPEKSACTLLFPCKYKLLKGEGKEVTGLSSIEAVGAALLGTVTVKVSESSEPICVVQAELV